jgi:hypothetical protein
MGENPGTPFFSMNMSYNAGSLSDRHSIVENKFHNQRNLSTSGTAGEEGSGVGLVL